MNICHLVVICFGLLTLCGSLIAGSGADICPRPSIGSLVTPPEEVSAVKGQLHVVFALRSQIDDYGLTRYCYIDDKGTEAPTLRVSPGDEVMLDFRNELTPVSAHEPQAHEHKVSSCSAGPMTAVSTNLHFHGLEIPPLCHQDDVIHTSIQPGQPLFRYRFRIPANQPPGMYWYHPHPHGFSEEQVLGGASGALIVEGIEKRKPLVAGLPERIMILRDQPIPIGTSGRSSVRKSGADEKEDEDGKDLSLNFVPVTYPLYLPAVVRVKPEQREFWRVLNASADTYFTLQLISVENGQRVPQQLHLIAMDGAPVSAAASESSRTEVLISPGARAEFIVTTPHAGALSQLLTRNYDTGPDGAANPNRVIANVIAGDQFPEPPSMKSSPALPPPRQSIPLFHGLAGMKPTRVRTLYFSDNRADLKTPGQTPKYFITAEGREPAVFDMNFKKPDITVRQGTVEDWIIENRAHEAHVFHIHQIHFQLVERDGVTVDEPMLRDTIDLPYWDGRNPRYPSVKLRMDFRSPSIAGTFLFHCHILEHEDGGMMGSVEVVKP